MHSYVIDELQDKNISDITAHLHRLGFNSSIEGMFWLPVPEEYLSQLQKEHGPQCAPYCMALVLEETSVHLEMLVRAKGKLHCPCVAYASAGLREHMISFLSQMLYALDIPS